MAQPLPHLLATLAGHRSWDALFSGPPWWPAGQKYVPSCGCLVWARGLGVVEDHLCPCRVQLEPLKS